MKSSQYILPDLIRFVLFAQETFGVGMGNPSHPHLCLSPPVEPPRDHWMYQIKLAEEFAGITLVQR